MCLTCWKGGGSEGRCRGRCTTTPTSSSWTSPTCGTESGCSRATSAKFAEPGDYLTLQVGHFPLVVVRGGDGELRALHNVCRHRGSVVCEEANGRAGRRLVCPYHQWTYDLTGRHVGGRSMPDDVDPVELGLGVADCAIIGGLIYVCVAAEPPDVAPLRSLVEPYLAPFDLERAVVAHRTTFVEHANWKLVVENNRECYHCHSAHPELCVLVPLLAPSTSGQARRSSWSSSTSSWPGPRRPGYPVGWPPPTTASSGSCGYRSSTGRPA